MHDFVCCGYVAERYILFASRQAAIKARQVRSKRDVSTSTCMGGDPRIVASVLEIVRAVTLLPSFSSSFRPLPDTIQAISNIQKPSKTKKCFLDLHKTQDTAVKSPTATRHNTGQQTRLPTQENCATTAARFLVL